MPTLYAVVFTGELSQGVSRDQARQTLAEKYGFKEQQLEKLLCGKRVVIARNVERDEAMAVKRKFETVGMVCAIAELKDGGTPAKQGPAKQGPAKAAPARQGAARKSPEEYDWPKPPPPARLELDDDAEVDELRPLPETPRAPNTRRLKSATRLLLESSEEEEAVELFPAPAGGKAKSAKAKPKPANAAAREPATPMPVDPIPDIPDFPEALRPDAVLPETVVPETVAPKSAAPKAAPRPRPKVKEPDAEAVVPALLRRYGQAKGAYPGLEAPPDKFKNALVNCPLVGDETIHGVLDTSGDCSTCIIFTQTHLTYYMDDEGQGKIPYADLAGSNIDVLDKTRIQLGDGHVMVMGRKAPMPAKQGVYFFLELQEGLIKSMLGNAAS